MPARCTECSRAGAPYGPRGTRSGLRCRVCRLEEDVNVSFVCKVCGAYKRMMYTDHEGDPPRRCVRCKKPDDVLVYRRYCRSPLHPPGRAFRVVVTSRTNYECYQCRHFGQWRTREERRVVEYLKRSVDRSPSSLNAIIGGNLSLRYRPDIYYDLGDRALVVEVDEHQHTGYPASCEAKRMAEIVMTVGVPVIFLRFNPHPQTPIEPLAKTVTEWLETDRSKWPSFMRAEYIAYSDYRQTMCERANDDILSQVKALMPMN